MESYQSALSILHKVCGEENGFVASENSSRGSNGKIRGTVVLRVAPENFDRLILKIRGIGDLKKQSISTQDVTEKANLSKGSDAKPPV